MSLLSKIATVLEALADEADAQPAASTTPDPLIAKMAERSGMPLSDELRAKIAQDAELRAVLDPLLQAPETPRSLGEPAEKAAETSPPSKAERRRLAEEAFAQAIMGHTRN